MVSKVPRADVPIIGRGFNVGSRLFLDDEGPAVHIVLTQRHDLSQSGRLHSGYVADTFQEVMKRRSLASRDLDKVNRLHPRTA